MSSDDSIESTESSTLESYVDFSSTEFGQSTDMEVQVLEKRNKRLRMTVVILGVSLFLSLLFSFMMVLIVLHMIIKVEDDPTTNINYHESGLRLSFIETEDGKAIFSGTIHFGEAIDGNFGNIRTQSGRSIFSDTVHFTESIDRGYETFETSTSQVLLYDKSDTSRKLYTVKSKQFCCPSSSSTSTRDQFDILCKSTSTNRISTYFGTDESEIRKIAHFEHEKSKYTANITETTCPEKDDDPRWDVDIVEEYLEMHGGWYFCRGRCRASDINDFLTYNPGFVNHILHILNTDWMTESARNPTSNPEPPGYEDAIEVVEKVLKKANRACDEVYLSLHSKEKFFSNGDAERRFENSLVEYCFLGKMDLPWGEGVGFCTPNEDTIHCHETDLFGKPLDDKLEEGAVIV